MSEDDAGAAADAAAAGAAAAVAAGPSSQTPASSPAQQPKKRKVRQERSTAEKLRALHGKCRKLPASRFSLLQLAAPIQTREEQQLFWELYMRYTKSGSTAWHNMAAVWNHRAHTRMANKDFTVSLKSERHLKDFHRLTVKSMMQQANFAADEAITAAGAHPVGIRLGTTATDLVPPPLPPPVPPTQVEQQLFTSSQADRTGQQAAAAAAAAGAPASTAATPNRFGGSASPFAAAAAKVRTAFHSLSPFKDKQAKQQQQQQQQAGGVQDTLGGAQGSAAAAGRGPSSSAAAAAAAGGGPSSGLAAAAAARWAASSSKAAAAATGGGGRQQCCSCGTEWDTSQCCCSCSSYRRGRRHQCCSCHQHNSSTVGSSAAEAASAPTGCSCSDRWARGGAGGVCAVPRGISDANTGQEWEGPGDHQVQWVQHAEADSR